MGEEDSSSWDWVVRVADSVIGWMSSVAMLGSEPKMNDGGVGRRLYALEIFCLAMEA